jgi:hypothetical protein
VLVGIRVAGLIRVMVNSTGETVPLPWGAELPMAYGAAVFMVVAAVACAMLIRAGWSREATHSA